MESPITCWIPKGMLTAWLCPVFPFSLGSHLWNKKVNSFGCGIGNHRCRQETLLCHTFSLFFFTFKMCTDGTMCLLPVQLPARALICIQSTGQCRIINLGGYATFCRDHMQPIKKLIWKSAQMTGQIRPYLWKVALSRRLHVKAT